MSNQYIFMLVILIVLIILNMIKFDDLSKNVDGFGDGVSSENNSGLYNYFHMRVMNPYSLPLYKFFTNDTQKPMDSNKYF